ncbi:AraC family transcriptional regulator [Paenibacillus daejeonensis]|uniref:AraC family transcriptional regulator n=1 Tax=Paenibacillus daejeonensis TaxID=135193 RepID=UPI0003675EB1|nr:AraC family transcriptional regulator [Paenibacillus daejeonensis]
MLMQEYDTFNYRLDSNMKPYIHSHTANEIYYFHSGKCQYLLGGELVDLIPGDLVVMNGIREHGPIMDNSMRYIRSTMMFEREALRNFALVPGMVDLSKPFQVETSYRWNLQGALKDEFELLLQQLNGLQEGNSAVALNRRSLKFYEILLFIYARFEEHADGLTSAPSEQEQLIHRVLSYIDRHFAEELSGEGIAEQMHVSKFYLMKLFKRYTKETVFDYVTKRRIAEAKVHFHSNPGHSVTDVCHRTGFKDASHFSRTFKKHTGLSPEQYRRLLLRAGNDSHAER